MPEWPSADATPAEQRVSVQEEDAGADLARTRVVSEDRPDQTWIPAAGIAVGVHLHAIGVAAVDAAASDHLAVRVFHVPSLPKLRDCRA